MLIGNICDVTMAAEVRAGTSKDPATQWQGDIDRYTGLPRLDIELLPGMEDFAKVSSRLVLEKAVDSVSFVTS